MSSYITPYNIAIANRQKSFDVRNLKHDAYEASQRPLHGGQVRDVDGAGLSGGDFWSDFADGFMSVMRPVGEVAKVIAPFIPKGAGACRCPRNSNCMCGRGLSGGDEIVDAEPAVLNPDLNSTGMFHGYGTSGGYNENVSGMGYSGGYREGLPGRSGGDFWSDLGNIASTVAPFLPLLGLGKDSSPEDKSVAIGRAMLGSGFFDDLLDGLNKVGQVAQAVAPHVEMGKKLYDKYGKGLSGGQKKVGQRLVKEMEALMKRGGMKGCGLSGGDFDWSTLASFAPLLLGLGMSGGQDEFDMSYLEPYMSASGMSGGGFIDDILAGINKALGKVEDFVTEGAKKVGDLVDKGVKVGSEGLDKIMPIVEKVGKVADTAGKVASLFGKKGEGRRAKDTRVLSGKQQLYKGGDMSVNAPYVGFDMATGKDFKRPVGGNSAELVALQQRSNVNQPYKTGDGRCCFNASECHGTKAYRFKKGEKSANVRKVSVKGRGQAGNSESLDQIEATDALVKELASANPAVNASPAGSGASGGKRSSKWIDHVKAYAKQHGVSYKQALKDAKATYRGAGQSGGDFWSDLGNVASTVAPFLPLLL